ncbi:MAG: hypothetical protein LE180_02105 [Endomicrobium sp.]|uniref:hypothetical protein n=1 Tax=Candidatus Endomicrobiellum pyrsonymphae TaxID=1408203 RepID=UPI003582B251|nr:hypothetical protein [Endomicrobium sp.]
MFAQVTGFSGNYLLQSVKNTEMKAFVNTDLKFVGQPPKLSTLFVIDTVINMSDIKNIDTCIKQLRDFKNTVFFENVNKDIKEFSK